MPLYEILRAHFPFGYQNVTCNLGEIEEKWRIGGKLLVIQKWIMKRKQRRGMCK